MVAYAQVTDDDVRTLMDNIIEKHFSNLSGCLIEPIFISTKKMSKGRYQLATLTVANALTKHIYGSVNGNDIDYILFIDFNLWYKIDEKDKELVMSHALEFADVNMDKDNPYTIRGAEVETFYDEIERTKEDPQWHQRHQDMAEQFYTKDK